jgi:hypothetical protein
MPKKPARVVPGELPDKLSQPAIRALHNVGYTSLRQLTTVTESFLKKLHGMGPHGIATIKAAMEAKGWSLAPEER